MTASNSIVPEDSNSIVPEEIINGLGSNPYSYTRNPNAPLLVKGVQRYLQANLVKNQDVFSATKTLLDERVSGLTSDALENAVVTKRELEGALRQDYNSSNNENKEEIQYFVYAVNSKVAKTVGQDHFLGRSFGLGVKRIAPIEIGYGYNDPRAKEYCKNSSAPLLVQGLQEYLRMLAEMEEYKGLNFAPNTKKLLDDRVIGLKDDLLYDATVRKKDLVAAIKEDVKQISGGAERKSWQQRFGDPKPEIQALTQFVEAVNNQVRRNIGINDFSLGALLCEFGRPSF